MLAVMPIKSGLRSYGGLQNDRLHTSNRFNNSGPALF